MSSSSVATSADKGIVALVLKTEEAGPVAFQVTVEACAVLRCQIAIAETLLNPRKKRLGRAPVEFGTVARRAGRLGRPLCIIAPSLRLAVILSAQKKAKAVNALALVREAGDRATSLRFYVPAAD